VGAGDEDKEETREGECVSYVPGRLNDGLGPCCWVGLGEGLNPDGAGDGANGLFDPNPVG